MEDKRKKTENASMEFKLQLFKLHLSFECERFCTAITTTKEHVTHISAVRTEGFTTNNCVKKSKKIEIMRLMEFAGHIENKVIYFCVNPWRQRKKFQPNKVTLSLAAD